jgi:hypothetical protein
MYYMGRAGSFRNTMVLVWWTIVLLGGNGL